MNNLEMISKKPDDDLLRKFYDLFNSDLSLLNQVIGDIDILMFLIDSVKIIPKERFEYEIDQMKYRLGNMTDIKYLKQEEVKKLLFSALKDPRADYRPMTMDELEKSWTDPDNLKIGC